MEEVTDFFIVDLEESALETCVRALLTFLDSFEEVSHHPGVVSDKISQCILRRKNCVSQEENKFRLAEKANRVPHRGKMPYSPSSSASDASAEPMLRNEKNKKVSAQ
jgi:hypothetical protein